MPSVDVLIPNHNTWPFVELCVESVLRRTEGVDIKVIVHDESTNREDRQYLEQAAQDGLITLISGNTRERWNDDRAIFSPHGHPAPYWHGCAVNVLVNETCRAPYAFLMDSDVYVVDRDWLSSMLDLMDGNAIVAAYEWQPGKRGTGVYVPGWLRPHYLLLDMAKYRDGMEVDWRGGSSTTGVEPYRTVFASLPHEIDRPRTGQEYVAWDPGTSLWLKMRYDNPHGYELRRIPLEVEQKSRHFEQGSQRKASAKELAEVERELRKVRRGH